MAFPGQLSDLTEENLANISLPGHPHTNPVPFVHEGATQPLPQSPSRRSHHSSTPSMKYFLGQNVIFINFINHSLSSLMNSLMNVMKFQQSKQISLCSLHSLMKLNFINELHAH